MNIIERPIPRGGTRAGGIQTPDRVIVHAMGERIRDNHGKVWEAPEWLEKCKYSAHILIYPNLDIVRCRNDNQEAIHAAGNNQDTLGIEFLVPGIHNLASLYEAIKRPYLADGQLDVGCEFVKEHWVETLGILRYEKHSKVDPKQLKQDPGEGFPWVKFLRGIGVIA